MPFMRVFNCDVAMKHVKNIKSLTQEFREHRIIVLGDFNMESVRWVADETNHQYLPRNTNESEFLNQMQEMSFYQLSNITRR